MAPRGDEGRGRRRYAPGSSQTCFDPEVSEWGNPAGVMSRHPEVEFIDSGKRTQGSETSQYLQEKKSTEIPKVAASEMGRAQTGRLRASGVVGPPSSDPRLDRGSVWEGAPERVKAPYPTSKVALEVPEYRGTREIPWESGRTIFQGSILLGDR